MLLRPRSGDWADPWMVHHEGSFWLYHVVEEGGVGVALGLWRSDDGVHWSDHGRVLSRWEGARSLGGGDLWRAPTFERDGRFLLGCTEQRGSIPARTAPAIYLAESTDLFHWRWLGPEYVYRPDPRWYRAEGSEARWHDLCTLPKDTGGRYGYCSADPIGPEVGFGLGETLDCCHWRALPPPAVDWGEHPPSALRMAGVTRAAGRVHLFFEGRRVAHERRYVYHILGPGPGGPFVPPPRNPTILETSAPDNPSLGLRLVEVAGRRLVSHVATTCHGERWLAPLKRLEIAEDGSARLAYWPGNDALRGEPLAVGAPAWGQGGETVSVTMLDRRLDTDAGAMLEGRWAGLPTQESDLFRGGGLYLETEPGRGEGILVPMLGQALAGPMGEHGADLRLEDSVDRELPHRDSGSFRLLLRGELAELYVENLLMCSIGLPGPATGRLGLVTSGRTEVRDLRAHRLLL